MLAEHRKYGDFVRVAPNHISINNPEAIAQIYSHKAALLKSNFYEAFVRVKPNVFSTQDAHEHKRKRRYQNPAFSGRAMADFEPHMDDELLKWKNQLLTMASAQGKGQVDFAIWGRARTQEDNPRATN